MTLYQKSKQVERLFEKLSPEIAKLTENTKLTCFTGCGMCCSKPTVEATVLEFLPFAMHCFLTGKAELALEEVKQLDGSPCHLFKPASLDGKSGLCSSYRFRGLICRLFGFSARKGKDENLQLYTCNRIKTESPEIYTRANEFLAKGGDAPIVSDYYRKLKNIDSQWGSEMMPINTAQRKALELVLHYYSYRPKPRPKAA